MNDRRKFFANSLSKLGLLAFGAISWSVFLSENSKAKFLLRPPGAKEEKEFLQTCIKCGLCVEFCPYETLKLINIGKTSGTPHFVPREVPCYMCEEVPCVKNCPTNALDANLLGGKNALNINKAKMGVAVVDKISCIAFWGIQCDACYRACPLMGEAIILSLKRNERTGKHAFLMPEIDPDICTGCGKCERACVSKKAAIFVLPRKMALGEVGEHYIKGWDQNDEKRLENLTTKEQKNIKAMDYLNSSEEF